MNSNACAFTYYVINYSLFLQFLKKWSKMTKVREDRFHFDKIKSCGLMKKFGIKDNYVLT
jgi:hypothetical protein